MEDVDSEKQKPLLFHFQTPCLQFGKDESKARIHWQAKGNVVANHMQHMVKTVIKVNKTSLYSSWLSSAEARRKHEALLAELRQGTSWLNMCQITPKACEPEKPLLCNFAMPMVELHSFRRPLPYGSKVATLIVVLLLLPDLTDRCSDTYVCTYRIEKECIFDAFIFNPARAKVFDRTTNSHD